MRQIISGRFLESDARKTVRCHKDVLEQVAELQNATEFIEAVHVSNMPSGIHSGSIMNIFHHTETPRYANINGLVVAS